MLYIQNLANDNATKQMEYVLFGDLSASLNGSAVLDLTLPGYGQSFTCNEINYEPKADGAYSWAGKLDGEAGYVGLLKAYGMLTGYVQTDTSFWEIIPFDSTVSIIRELKISEFQNEVCGTTSIPGYTPPVENTDLCGGNFCAGIIDVLVLIPPDVTAWYGTQNFWAALVHFYGSMAAFETALGNSGVDGISMRFHYSAFSFAYSLAIQTDLSSLATTASGLRDAYRADLVVMLTSMNYVGIRGAASKDGIYLISEVQSNFAPTWTLAHELAHQFGAEHNRSANVPCPSNDPNCGDDQDDCRHGWRFTTGGQDRTIMSILYATSIPVSSRALHFSNPDVTFNGFATGTSEDDNAQAVAEKACEVIAYHIDPFFGVEISAPSQVCSEDGDFTASASIRLAAPAYSNHPPPYTYSWSATNTSVSANGPNAYISFNCAPACFVTVSVTMTAGDGATFTESRMVNILSPPCFRSKKAPAQSRSAYGNSNQEIAGNLGDVVVHPNPVVDNFVNLSLPESYEQVFQFSIYDIRGTLMHTGKARYAESLEIDLTTLPSGVYFIRLEDANEMTVRKIVKN